MVDFSIIFNDLMHNPEETNILPLFQLKDGPTFVSSKARPSCPYVCVHVLSVTLASLLHTVFLLPQGHHPLVVFVFACYMCKAPLLLLSHSCRSPALSSLSCSLAFPQLLPLFHPSLLHTLYLPLSVPHLLSSPSSCHAITFIFCSPPLSLPLSPLSLSLSPLSLLPSLPHALSPLSFPPSLALCGSLSVPVFLVHRLG